MRGRRGERGERGVRGERGRRGVRGVRGYVGKGRSSRSAIPHVPPFLTFPRSSRRIVPARAAGHIEQRGRGTEPLAELLLKLIERLHHSAGAEIVDHAEWSTAKGGETDAEDRPDVGISRAAHHILRARHGRFV